MTKQVNLTKTLEQLTEIADWFDQQTQIDVEEGLTKVKEAAGLIKESKARLKEIENEFTEIKAEIQEAGVNTNEPAENAQEVVEELEIPQTASDNEELAKEDIPF